MLVNILTQKNGSKPPQGLGNQKHKICVLRLETKLFRAAIHAFRI